MALNIEKELQRLLLIEHENVEDGVEGACESYNLEMSFYDTVANGNLEELINNNKQGDEGFNLLYESNARKLPTV